MEITLEIAELTIAAAKKMAGEIGMPMNIAIVDDGANLLSFCRMDKAWLGSMDIAIKKAKTARFFNIETGEIGKLSQPGGPLYQVELSNGGLISFPGGIPLKNIDGGIIAAIGVSGGSIAQDYLVAAAGAQSLQRPDEFIQPKLNTQEEEIQEALHAHWNASAAGDLNAEHVIYDDDAICDYPQSGERILGRKNLQALRGHHPGKPSGFAIRRMTGSAELWITQYTIRYKEQISYTVSIMEFRGGKVVHETQYFADPFAAPAWRKQWVQQTIKPANNE